MTVPSDLIGGIPSVKVTENPVPSKETEEKVAILIESSLIVGLSLSFSLVLLSSFLKVLKKRSFVN